MATPSILSFLSKDNPFVLDGKKQTLALNSNGKLIVVEKPNGASTKISRFFRTLTQNGKIEEATRLRDTLQELQRKVNIEITGKTSDLWGFQSNGLKIENVVKNVQKITEELQAEATALDTKKKAGVMTFNDAAPAQPPLAPNSLEGLIEDVNRRCTDLYAIRGKMKERSLRDRVTLSDKMFTELSREERIEVEVQTIEKRLVEIEGKLSYTNDPKLKHEQNVLQYAKQQLLAKTSTLTRDIATLEGKLNNNMGSTAAHFGAGAANGNKAAFQLKTDSAKIEALKMLIVDPNTTDVAQKKIMKDLLVALEAAQHIKKVDHPESTGMLKMVGMGAHTVGDELASIHRDLDKIEKALPHAAAATRASLLEEREVLRLAEQHLTSGDTTAYLNDIDQLLTTMYTPGSFNNAPFQRAQFEKLSRKEQIQKLAAIMQYDKLHAAANAGNQYFVNPANNNDFNKLYLAIRAAERIERADEVKQSAAVAAQISQQFKPSFTSRAASGIGGYATSLPRLLTYAAYTGYMLYGDQIGEAMGYAANALPKDQAIYASTAMAIGQVVAPIVLAETVNYLSGKLGSVTGRFRRAPTPMAALAAQIAI